VSLLGPIQQLSRLGVFKGGAEQFTYIARDEQAHIGFGVALIREFMAQYPEAVTYGLVDTIMADTRRAIELEQDYMAYCLKDGPILGYSVHEHVETAKYFANMRLGSVGLPQPFDEAYHAFPWMSEQMELKKEKNFFETRVTEYQSGGALLFDDDNHDHANPGWSDPLDAGHE
jgi:ribonucleoside-diphosphate reductase beta chain